MCIFQLTGSFIWLCLLLFDSLICNGKLICATHFLQHISCVFFFLPHNFSGHGTKKSSIRVLLPNTHFCRMLDFEGIRFQTMCWASAAVSLPIIIGNQYNTLFNVQQKDFHKKQTQILCLKLWGRVSRAMKNESSFSPWCVWSVPNGSARMR